MRNKLKGLAFLCMAVALPLTAQNVTVSGPDGKLQLTVSCRKGRKHRILSLITENRCWNHLRWVWRPMWEISMKAMKLTGIKKGKLILFTRNRVSKLQDTLSGQ